jgi:(p)ppGpp synthase/HD superfamily hydrolase
MTTKTKRQRFQEVAGIRVQMVLDKIDNLSKCANKKNYEFSQNDIDKMFRAITHQIKVIKIKFEGELNEKGKEKKTFKF